MNESKYPNVFVQLSGENGNIFSVIGRVCRALRKGGVSEEEIDAFWKEAKSKDYNHVFQTVMRWVDTG